MLCNCSACYESYLFCFCYSVSWVWRIIGEGTTQEEAARNQAIRKAVMDRDEVKSYYDVYVLEDKSGKVTLDHSKASDHVRTVLNNRKRCPMQSIKVECLTVSCLVPSFPGTPLPLHVLYKQGRSLEIIVTGDIVWWLSACS